MLNKHVKTLDLSGNILDWKSFLGWARRGGLDEVERLNISKCAVDEDWDVVLEEML